MNKAKTWKREAAALMMLGLSYVVWTGDVSMVEVLVWPVFSFAGLAFGLDVYSNANGMRNVPTFSSTRGRNERSGKHPSGETEQPDHWHLDRAGAWNPDGDIREGK
jgi:hypothetical protein